MAARLAKLGYYGGDPEKVMQAPVDMVQTLIEYVGFESDYQEEDIELNSGA